MKFLFIKGQPQLVEQALTGASTTLVTLTENEGAGEHTHAGGLGRAHQTLFDWLDATLTNHRVSQIESRLRSVAHE